MFAWFTLYRYEKHLHSNARSRALLFILTTASVFCCHCMKMIFIAMRQKRVTTSPKRDRVFIVNHTRSRHSGNFQINNDHGIPKNDDNFHPYGSGWVMHIAPPARTVPGVASTWKCEETPDLPILSKFSDKTSAV